MPVSASANAPSLPAATSCQADTYCNHTYMVQPLSPRAHPSSLPSLSPSLSRFPTATFLPQQPTLRFLLLFPHKQTVSKKPFVLSSGARSAATRRKWILQASTSLQAASRIKAASCPCRHSLRRTRSLRRMITTATIPLRLYAMLSASLLLNSLQLYLRVITLSQEGFESLAHGDQFQQFDYTQNLNAQHHPQPPPAFPGPPTPPFAQRQQQQQQQQQQQHLQAPNHQQQQPPSRNGSIHSGSGGTGADMLSLANGGTNPHGDALMGDEAQLVRGGSEDDDSMTPAQSRRKAQNRAAYVLSFSSFSTYP